MALLRVASDGIALKLGETWSLGTGLIWSLTHSQIWWQTLVPRSGLSGDTCVWPVWLPGCITSEPLKGAQRNVSYFNDLAWKVTEHHFAVRLGGDSLKGRLGFKEEGRPQWEAKVAKRAGKRHLPLLPSLLIFKGSNTNNVWESNHSYEFLSMLFLFLFEGIFVEYLMPFKMWSPNLKHFFYLLSDKTLTRQNKKQTGGNIYN